MFMHLSMLGRRGGRRGKGAGFDEKVYPVSGEFDDQYSPGQGYLTNFKNCCHFAYIMSRDTVGSPEHLG